MELSEILDSLSGNSETTKVASDNSLSQAIDRALSSDNFDKVASHHQANPSDDLIKIAHDISNAEQDALIKEATIYGRAVADGFASRMSQYNQTGNYDVSGDTIKEAMELGYIHATNAISNDSYGHTKQASYYEDDYSDQVKVASYIQGQEDAVKVASYIQGQEDAVKVASHIAGSARANQVVGNLIKVASHYEDFGFKIGNAILRKL